MRADSKDVDIIVRACVNSRGDRLSILARIATAMRDLGAADSIAASSAESEDFPWAGLVKCVYKGQEFDILLADENESTEDIMAAFPLTIQQVGYGHNEGVFYGSSFSTYLDLSPGRRQVTNAALGKVMGKYMEYYPEARITTLFLSRVVSILKQSGGIF